MMDDRLHALEEALRDLLDNLGGHSHWREGGSGGTCETCVRQGDAAARARAVLAGVSASPQPHQGSAKASVSEHDASTTEADDG